MAILDKLFSRKDRQKTNNETPTPTSAASDFDTLEAESTEHDRHSPRPKPLNSPYTNAAASSSKLKLPFLSKKAKISSSTPAESPEPTHGRQYPSSRSEAAVDSLRPPPVKSPVFGLYRGARGVDSTHSLPAHSDDKSRPAVPKKSGGIMAWARNKPPHAPPSTPHPQGETEETSFNLRAFRHVRSPSLGGSTIISLSNSTTSVLPPARPRPRENSTTSDSSQRISAAAFREMQARRSAATSPTPSASRSTPISDYANNANSSNLRPPSKINSSSGQNSLQKPTPGGVIQSTRKSTLRLSSSSDSSESVSSDEDRDSSSGVDRKSKSNVGHRPSPVTNSSQSAVQEPSVKGRARASTAPSIASGITIKQNHVGMKGHPPRSVGRVAKNSDTSDSDSDDDDDAPLASLVGPRRPGSAMSTSTNRTIPRKPLIDINTLTTPFTSSSATASRVSLQPQQSLSTPKKDALPPTNVSDRLAKVVQGPGLKPPLNRAPGIVSENSAIDRAKSREGSSKDGPAMRVRSMTSPEVGADVALPPRLVKPADRRATAPPDNIFASIAAKFPDSVSTSPSTDATNSVGGISPDKGESLPVRPKRMSLCLDDTSDPIVPTLIHHRTPVPRFAVTSRPSYQQGLSPRLSQQPDSPMSENRNSPVDRKPYSFPKKEPASPSPPDPNYSQKRDTLDFTRLVLSSLDSDKTSGDLPESKPERKDTIRPSRRTTKPTALTINSNNSQTAPISPSVMSPAPSSSAASTSFSRPPSTAPPPAPSPSRPSPSSTTAIHPRSFPSKSVAPPSARTSIAITRNSIMSASTSTSGLKPKSRRMSSRPNQPPLVSLISDSPTNNSVPLKPFASGSEFRGYSPASSTGDSSSGRGAPVTPRDGSDIASEIRPGSRGAASGAGASASSRGPVGNKGGLATNARRAAHKKSLSNDDKTNYAANSSIDGEARRKERRRLEAKNAIDLGNVMHKPIQLDEDEDEGRHAGLGADPRLNMFNPLTGMNGMGMGMGMQTPQIPMNMAPTPWLAPSNQGPMLHPFMIPQPPPNTDPRFLAAHQQAMMIAKQAYQYAVAQQAMAAAADEWDRGSSITMMSGNVGGWGSSPGVMFPSGPRTMYAGSMYGGSDNGSPGSGGWGSSSVYGGSFGPAPAIANRSSMMPRGSHTNLPQRSEPGHQFSPPSAHFSGPRVRPRTKTAPSESGGPLLAHLAHENARARGRTTPPPSSWSRQQEGD